MLLPVIFVFSQGRRQLTTSLAILKSMTMFLNKYRIHSNSIEALCIDILLAVKELINNRFVKAQVYICWFSRLVGPHFNLRLKNGPKSLETPRESKFTANYEFSLVIPY